MTHQDYVIARDDRSPAHSVSGVSKRNFLMNTLVSVASLASSTAIASPAVTTASACTFPPDLIERFVRMRAWYLDYRQREILWSDEMRPPGSTGAPSIMIILATTNCWRFTIKSMRKFRVLRTTKPSANRLTEERWNVAKAMFSHEPQTVVDLAWQTEAYLIADLEILGGSDTSDWMGRTLFRHIRSLGALPQPDDPLDLLSIDVDNDDDEEEEEA
jgi:hypothetical protein